MSLETAAGSTLSLEEIKASLDQHKPAVLFLCQVTFALLDCWTRNAGSFACPYSLHVLCGWFYYCSVSWCGAYSLMTAVSSRVKARQGRSKASLASQKLAKNMER